ncbi:MAG TPA: hypothetical protein VK171_11815, partial [Fimbriimonas sp.]|nr:hypothetical protein [Fimbriimonas sp.]
MVLLTSERDDQFHLTLARGVDLVPMVHTICNAKLIEEFFCRVTRLRSLASHEASNEMRDVGLALADLLGDEFMGAVKSALLAPPVTFRILCDCPASYQ